MSDWLQERDSPRFSLRTRIIGSFVLFSIVPLLVLAVGGYFQLRQTLINSLESRTTATADRVSRQIEERYHLAEAYLPGLGLLLQTAASERIESGEEKGLRARDIPSEAWAASGGPFLALNVVDASGTVLRTFTDPQTGDRDTQELCPGAPDHWTSISVSLDLAREQGGGSPVHLVGRLAPRFLLSGSGGDPLSTDERLLFLDRPGERLVDRSGCPVDSALPQDLMPALLALEHPDGRRSGGTLWYDTRDTDLVVSHASISRPPWTVVITANPARAGAAARELGTGFLLMVLAVGALTSLGFGFLLRPVTRSLTDLTRAMGLISEGDLNPWLPPPSGAEMGELTLATSEMASRIGSTVERMKQKRESAFVGDMARHLAHEVRNPLSSIRINLQSLDREISEERIPSDYSDVMSVCLNEIHRLDQLVGEVLTLGRLPEPSLHPCSLRSIVEASVEIVRPEFQEAGQHVETTIEAERDQILGDQNQLTALFVNLLLNSQEVVPPGGHVWISLENRTGPDGDRRMWVSARVADDGPGIPPEIRDKIFRPFFSTKGGSGIGLTVARSVARAHGGDLYFEKDSELTPGAEFVLLLPLQRVKDEPSGGSETSQTADVEQALLPSFSRKNRMNGT